MENKIPKFRNVALDFFTYEQLTILAQEAKISRTEYLRNLIRPQAISLEGFKKEDSDKKQVHRPSFAGVPVADFVVDTQAQAEAAKSGDKIIFRHGEVILESDLNSFQRAATRYFQKRGKILDSRKYPRKAKESGERLLETIMAFIFQEQEEPAFEKQTE